MSQSHVLGDWGTSRLRLYRISGGGVAAGEVTGSEVTGRLNGPGIGSLETSARRVLEERLEVWLAEGPISGVTLCGMAGAPGGLVEAGYAPCPARSDTWLGAGAVTEVSGVPVMVMPGLSCRTAGDVPEVMRGEETQIFGAVALQPDFVAGRHVIVLPGTHSKWVIVEDGTVSAFHTHPTGELFALLSGQSTLTGPDTPGEGTFDDGFTRGLERCEEPLTAALFEARAARMLGGKAKDWSRGYLSGLLIGHEVAVRAGPETAITLIGDPALARLYERALAARGCTLNLVDGDAAVIAGLKLARGKA